MKACVRGGTAKGSAYRSKAPRTDGWTLQYCMERRIRRIPEKLKIPKNGRAPRASRAAHAHFWNFPGIFWNFPADFFPYNTVFVVFVFHKIRQNYNIAPSIKTVQKTSRPEAAGVFSAEKRHQQCKKCEKRQKLGQTRTSKSEEKQRRAFFFRRIL